MEFIKFGNCELKLQGRHDNFVLFRLETGLEYDSDAVPVIHINGSQEAHFREDGKLKSLTRLVTPGNFMHANSVYNRKKIPYIGLYIVNENEKDYSYHFAKGLMETIKSIPSDQIVLEAVSYGAVIGMQASANDQIKRVVAINPCFEGSPLVNVAFGKAKYDKTLAQKVVTSLTVSTIETHKYYENEKAQGVWLGDLDVMPSKIQVYGGSINHLPKKIHNLSELFMHLGADGIYELSGKPSDGMVIYDPAKWEKMGMDVTEMKYAYHTNATNSAYMATITKDYLSTLYRARDVLAEKQLDHTIKHQFVLK